MFGLCMFFGFLENLEGRGGKGGMVVCEVYFKRLLLNYLSIYKRKLSWF